MIGEFVGRVHVEMHLLYPIHSEVVVRHNGGGHTESQPFGPDFRKWLKDVCAFHGTFQDFHHVLGTGRLVQDIQLQ